MTPRVRNPPLSERLGLLHGVQSREWVLTNLNYTKCTRFGCPGGGRDGGDGLPRMRDAGYLSAPRTFPFLEPASCAHAEVLYLSALSSARSVLGGAGRGRQGRSAVLASPNGSTDRPASFLSRPRASFSASNASHVSTGHLAGA